MQVEAARGKARERRDSNPRPPASSGRVKPAAARFPSRLSCAAMWSLPLSMLQSCQRSASVSD